MSAFQRNHELLIAGIEQKQEAAERAAEGFLKELGQEINGLQKRNNDIQYLECTEDPLHRIEVSPAYSKMIQ